jgi:ribosomal protein S27E
MPATITFEELKRAIVDGGAIGIEGNPVIDSGVEYKLFDSVDMPDGEKLTFFEGFCRKCNNDTMHVYSHQVKRFICTGCGKRIHPRSLTEKVLGLPKRPKNGAENAD